MKTYAEESFDSLKKTETGHFWFEERNNLIVWTIQKFSKNVASFLEVGCGTGFVLQRIAREFPEANLTGVDYYESSLPIAQLRSPKAKFAKADITSLNFDKNFDMIGCFDVLEHIHDDRLAIINLYNALKAGGILFVTVPQHPFLWNANDEYAFHVRRYSSSELQSKLCDAGFEIIYTTSFMSIILPLMILRKLRKKVNDIDAKDSIDFRPPRLVNKFMRIFLRFEQFFIRQGLKIHIGGSRLVVAKKQ